MRGAMPELVAETLWAPTNALASSAAIETDPCKMAVFAHLMTYLPYCRGFCPLAQFFRLLFAGRIPPITVVRKMDHYGGRWSRNFVVKYNNCVGGCVRG